MMNRREAIAATFAALVLPSGEEIVNCSGYNLDGFYGPFVVVSSDHGNTVCDSNFRPLDHFESEYVAMQVSWQLNVNCGFRNPELPF